MADRVELDFRRSAGPLLPRGSRIVAAVSGGSDSVALLHLLVRFAGRAGWDIVPAHLDHGLRPDSASDRAFVEALSRSLGLDCVSDRRDVAAARRRDESPEEAARRVRRGFLLEAAELRGAQRIATGHTLDDQAETVLMRLVRGAGATAIGGIAACGHHGFVRPLLGIERSCLAAYLDRHGIAHREDPSNADARFDRNRVRRLVLPLLAAQLNPRAARHLVEAAARIREDALHLDGLARGELRRLTRRRTSGTLALDSAELARLAVPIAKRLARLALEDAGADARRIGSRHIEAVLDLARGGRGREVHLPDGLLARRVERDLVLGPAIRG
jgi:tRNA(Ile)-lysidine synthase